MSQAATAPMGHNSGDMFEEKRNELDEYRGKLIETGDKWRTAEDRQEITDQATADKLAGYLQQCQKFTKVTEDARKAEKQPHLDAGRAVDNWFSDFKTPVESIVKALKPRLQKFLQEQDRKKQEEARKRREEAEAKQREIDEAKRAAAESETPTADEEALRQQEEEAARLAEEAEAISSQKTQVRSEFGNATSLRTKWVAQITDYDAALAHFKDTDEVRAVIEKLANGLARSPAGRQVKVPGVNFKEEKVL